MSKQKHGTAGMAVHGPTLPNKANPEPFYSRKLHRLKRDAFHPILSPYKSYAYLPTLECLRTLATMLYKIYHTFWMNLEYYKPIITMDVLTETLTLKLKLTLISSLFDVKFWKELHIFCINVFHMTYLVLRYQMSKIHKYTLHSTI
jgi:hypothetical protein